MSDGKLDALVAVNCRTCLNRFGVSTLLGEMVLWPSDEPDVIPGWAWLPTVRTTDLGKRTRRRRGWADDEAPRSGGQELRCHRCGATVRFNVSRLAQRAEAAATGDGPTRRGRVTI